jgi:NADP-dependent 3-hydroxy acid dehydrogenase YdfG
MGRNRERADAVARELGGLALPADVLRRPRGGQGAAARALGRVDILVNAAGGTTDRVLLGVRGSEKVGLGGVRCLRA